jgi:uncharacterized RDD family membrane protein YckC
MRAGAGLAPAHPRRRAAGAARRALGGQSSENLRIFAFPPQRGYQFAMSDGEPAHLRGPSEAGAPRLPAPQPAREPLPYRPRREPSTVYVVGFWRRLAAALIDLAVVIPAALIVTLLASRITGLRIPMSHLHVLDIDLWIDLALATDPALVMALVLFGAIGLVYLLVFQIVVGQTLGMRVLKMKIIDVYGERPSAPRCVARCAGYLAGVATLFLGFLWMGFDSEKRGLQDWIAGTYVIRA